MIGRPILALLGLLSTNVPMSTADLLSYSILIVVAIFLLAGPAIVYIYYRKSKRERVAQQATAA
jgi:cbb3-type cytochrome oxidase subunit 3